MNAALPQFIDGLTSALLVGIASLIVFVTLALVVMLFFEELR